MKSVKATGWSLDAILAIGNIFAFEDADDQTGAAGGAAQDNSNDDDDNDNDASGADGSDDDDDKDGDDDAEVLRKKLKNRKDQAARQDAEIKRLKAVEKKADELQKAKDEQDRKGRTELENLKADVEAKDKALAAKDDTIRRLTIENAFMSLDGIEWHNPAKALKLVDLSEVEFDPDSGAVKDRKQLVKAAKKLADEEPYMVKSKTDVSKDTPSGKPTGKPPAGGKPKAASEEALRSKYNIPR